MGKGFGKVKSLSDQIRARRPEWAFVFSPILALPLAQRKEKHISIILYHLARIRRENPRIPPETVDAWALRTYRLAKQAMEEEEQMEAREEQNRKAGQNSNGRRRNYGRNSKYYREP